MNFQDGGFLKCTDIIIIPIRKKYYLLLFWAVVLKPHFTSAIWTIQSQILVRSQMILLRSRKNTGNFFNKTLLIQRVSKEKGFRHNHAAVVSYKSSNVRVFLIDYFRTLAEFKFHFIIYKKFIVL